MTAASLFIPSLQGDPIDHTAEKAWDALQTCVLTLLAKQGKDYELYMTQFAGNRI